MRASRDSERGFYSLLLHVQKSREFCRQLAKNDTSPLILYSFKGKLFAGTVNTGNSSTLIFNHPVSEEDRTSINSDSGLILSRLWSRIQLRQIRSRSQKLYRTMRLWPSTADKKVQQLDIRYEAENASISSVLISRYIHIVLWWCLDESCAEFKVFLSSKPNSEEPIFDAVFLKMLAKYPDESLCIQKDGSDSPLSSWDAHLLSVVVLNNQLFSSRNVLTLRQSNFYA